MNNSPIAAGETSHCRDRVHKYCGTKWSVQDMTSELLPKKKKKSNLCGRADVCNKSVRSVDNRKVEVTNRSKADGMADVIVIEPEPGTSWPKPKSFQFEKTVKQEDDGSLKNLQSTVAIKTAAIVNSRMHVVSKDNANERAVDASHVGKDGAVDESREPDDSDDMIVIEPEPGTSWPRPKSFGIENFVKREKDKFSGNLPFSETVNMFFCISVRALVSNNSVITDFSPEILDWI